MNSYEIILGQKPAGQLCATPEGLYCQYCAELPEIQGLVRIYLVFPEQTVLLGTALPEGDGLCCRRHLSLRQAPADSLLGAVAVAQEACDWQPMEPGGLVRFTGDQVQLAQPAVEDQLLQDPTAYQKLTPMEWNGASYLVRSCSFAEYLAWLENPPVQPAPPVPEELQPEVAQAEAPEAPEAQP